MLKKYSFQRRKNSFTLRLFKGGLNVAACILLSIKEGATGFLTELPSSYPAFKFWKEVFGVNNHYAKPSFKSPTVRTNLRRLVAEGLIVKDIECQCYRLTDKGHDLVNYANGRVDILRKPWDGKLRIVIFDIPEKQKSWRESIRSELLLLQFQLLQKSVYVGKYPLPESFCREIESGGVGHYVFIFTVDKVDRKDEILKLLESQE